MTRAPSTSSSGDEKGAGDGLKKGPWTPDEDQKLLAYIQKHGHGSWRSLPLNAGACHLELLCTVNVAA